MGKYTVFVSKRADTMLIRHARFLANVSAPAAKGMKKDFSKVLDALEENPFQFPVETEYNCLRDSTAKRCSTSGTKCCSLLKGKMSTFRS